MFFVQHKKDKKRVVGGQHTNTIKCAIGSAWPGQLGQSCSKSVSGPNSARQEQINSASLTFLVNLLGGTRRFILFRGCCQSNTHTFYLMDISARYEHLRGTALVVLQRIRLPFVFHQGEGRVSEIIRGGFWRLIFVEKCANRGKFGNLERLFWARREVFDPKI